MQNRDEIFEVQKFSAQKSQKSILRVAYRYCVREGGVGREPGQGGRVVCWLVSVSLPSFQEAYNATRANHNGIQDDIKLAQMVRARDC